MSEWDRRAVEYLTSIASIDPEMAALISGFPWVSDGVTPRESSAILVFSSLASENYEFAKAVLDLWWVPDDMPAAEALSLGDIRGLTRSNLPMAWQAIGQPFMEPPFRRRDQYALKSLHWLTLNPPGTTRGTDLHALLSRYTWFNDGIDDLEAVLLYVIGNSKREFGRVLADAHYVASVPVGLPLTGEVELVVVRHTPFPADDHTFDAMEEGIRAAEGFMGDPFPVTDVILLVSEPAIWDAGGGKFVGGVGGGHGEGYLDAYIVINSSASGPSRSSIYHELAHHYYLHGPSWLKEGVANFLEAYTLAETGGVALEARLTHLQSIGCGRDNIQQHIDSYGGKRCDYHLGEQFVLGMYLALGREPVAAALRDLHAQSSRIVFLNEGIIFHAFQSNVPPEKQEAFSSAYRRYHGGALDGAAPIDAQDLFALIALYDSAKGEDWKANGNWTTFAPLGTWHGVATESRGRVRVLNLAGNQLTGTLPAALGNLSNLRTLRLQVNSLTGEIPWELGNLSKLVSVNLSGNQLTGEIPRELADLSSLVALNLEVNQLTGTIPSELADIGGLVQLVLGQNRLTGEIPPELASLSELSLLALEDNLLTGSIPAELGALYSLESLDLARNQLTGEIPLELTHLTELSAVDLEGNLLTGNIPPALGNINTLRSLYLAHNQLTGEIPHELTQLPNLTSLMLKGNHLTGCIPPALEAVRINDLSELGLPYCAQ